MVFRTPGHSCIQPVLNILFSPNNKVASTIPKYLKKKKTDLLNFIFKLLQDDISNAMFSGKKKKTEADKQLGYYSENLA